MRSSVAKSSDDSRKEEGKTVEWLSEERRVSSPPWTVSSERTPTIAMLKYMIA